MNKNDLVATVSEKTGRTRNDVSHMLDAALDTIARTLKKGGEVRLVGFGSFYVSSRKASKGRNPRTGAPIALGASRVPKFKAGKVLKQALTRTGG